MKLELRHLNLVRTVVEEGGLTRAGQLLGLSQSALSHQLRDIEELLGVSLFHRVGRRLSLAPAGERILRTARVVLPEIERAELDLNRDSKEMLGTIRIGVECDSCYSWLAGSLRRFGRRYPNIVLQLSTTSAQRPIQALLKNDIDLAVVAQPVRELRIRLCELFEEEFVAVVAPAHSLAEKEYLLPKDFASETLFCPGTFSEGLLYQKVLRPAGIRPKEVNEITLMEPTLQLVKYGFGITVLARWAIHSRPANDEFRTVPITSRGLRRTWHAATRSSRNLPEYLTTLLEALQSESGR
ncbi:MAG: LysR family transcriptional regulator [Verrucomicrobia bacterium]|nr:LysR family transcriptional regulator [Verrucomicrobiota bacterium]